MSDRRSLGGAVNRIARLLRRLADQRLAPYRLSSGYLPVLTALVDGPLSQKALVERVGIEQPTMAATLARMGRDGVIERRTDADDRRSALFSLAPATRGRMGAITATIDALSADALAGLDADEQAQLYVLLDKVSTAIGRALRDG